MTIATRVTRMLGIDYPILQAGMSWASSNAALPLAVSEAGGLGVIAAGPMYPGDLAQAIDTVRSGTSRPFAVNIPLYGKQADEKLDIIESRRVPVIIASQGGAARYVERFRARGTVCLHVVASEKHARKAADAGVDGVIAVGGEAGGHPPADLVSTLVLTRALVKALSGRIPVIAAGGIADGAGLAAVLALGAEAASIGTRFMATPEAGIHENYRRAVLAAGVGDTRTVGAGLGMIRSIDNAFTRRMQEAEAENQDLETRRATFLASSLKMAALHGDMEDGKVEAGQSAGLVDDIVPAGALVRRIAQEYRAARSTMP